MKTKLMVLPMMGAAALALGGCAENYSAEGAGVGAALGAGVAAITGEDLVTYAAAGAAAGAIAGYFKDKNDECDGYYDRDGRYLDDDCRDDDRYRRYF
ncbi:glycine zipper domain-containing protein [Croceicoccus sp. F390]|uniref:Glycine zipper domain-containing protein n=1 Tax=Croceicoccus esteveae TaxID=3075597 RepID=A0ABU2ZH60_9SPHN|nr:glycine zipper domain-containing protein [Croceicoccus sp. F390]MDT0575541.1 glycine zipper domain-containing protein [Croceicoccus sp. F390]